MLNTPGLQSRPDLAIADPQSQSDPRTCMGPTGLTIEDSVDLFGDASTSALTLYDGYQYFRFRHGDWETLIAYVDTGRAWVAASDPIGPPDMRARALDAFFATAKSAGKTSIALPVSSLAAHASRSSGLRVLQIGSEPWFCLKDFDFARYRQRVSVAARLMGRGAQLESLTLSTMDNQTREEINSLTSEWIESRSSAPFEFLNRVEPWSCSDYKRYFRLRFQNGTHAFLAAIAVPARNAWYLVDLIRSPRSAVGATELLVGYAMDKLKKEGAAEVTLGLCPLALVDLKERSHSPRLYDAMAWCFEHSSAFYGFKSLFEYRSKLGPTRWEPKYLVTRDATSSYKIARAFLGAIYPKGLRPTLLELLRRKLLRAAQESFAALGIKLKRATTILKQSIVRSRR